jgi:hypothetical protein
MAELAIATRLSCACRLWLQTSTEAYRRAITKRSENTFRAY